MKRKAFIFVLALVMLVSMFPVSAHAATTMKPSDSCIDLIKYFEGYRKYPYWDYTQWSMGYGSKCPDDKVEYYKKNGISEKEAEELLLDQMQSYVDTVNKFASKYDLNFTQSQFDALVSFTYNVGGSWTNGAKTHVLTQAVINGTTGNEFLAAFGLWSNAGGEVLETLVKRRLIEANLYLNGVNSTKIPTNYNYVLFDHTTSVFLGATRTVRVLCYDSKLGSPTMPQGTRTGYRFLGWYTKSAGGEWVDSLNDSHDGKKLYVHWQKGEGNVDSSGDILGTEASYTRTASQKLKIYEQPKQSAKTTGTVKSGTTMNIVADYVTADNVKWGLLKQGGWVCLSDNKTVPPADEDDKVENDTKPEETVPEETKPADKVIAKGMVSLTSGTLNVRAGAGDTYSKVSSLANGAFVDIYEIVTVGSHQWGRVSKGWVRMDYVKVAETKTLTVNSVNIRSGAGTGNSVVGTYKKGDKLYIFETTKVGTHTWGHTDEGWVDLTFAKLVAETEETVIATGKVTSSSVNIRKGAGTKYSKVGTYEKGTILKFYETKKVGSYTWGRVSKGWVRMDNVKVADTKTLTVSSVNIRSGAGTENSVVGTYKKGDQLHIFETTKIGTHTWGHTDKGWVDLTFAKLVAATEETVIATGKVTISSVNIRKGAGTKYSKVGTYEKGAILKFYETKKVGSYTWGRVSKGWVRMDNVKVADTKTLTVSSVNIRSAAGTENSVVGTYKKGDKLHIFETTKIGTHTWGHTDKGWVDLTFAKLVAATEETVIATGKVTSSSVNIRKGAGTKYSKVGTYEKGAILKFYETKKVGSYTWGRVSKGWVRMDNVKVADTKTLTVSSVNIRSGAGTENSVVGTYKKGDKLHIFETTKIGTHTWGHTDKGWVDLTFAKLVAATEEKVIATGKVTGSSVNIRKGAGTKYSKVGTYEKGATVKFYETKKVSGTTWGRTNKGWISLEYVKLDSTKEETVIVTGKVIADALRIRKGAGSSYEIVGSYLMGETVKIYETKKVDGVTWGRTSKGWVSMDYVQTSTSTSVSRTGTVSVSGTANIREGAGTSYSKVGTVKSGTKLTITKLKMVNDSPWGKISSGWICLDNVKMDKPASGAPALTTGSDLNIRKGAGTTYEVVGKYDKGVVITVLETKTVNGVSWARTNKGWVSMDYVL